jgi:ElaB/YqjD/DUF883 family membrane-anchored ribosome-binding protein
MHTGAHRADSVFGTANMTEGQFREGNAALGRSKEELIQEFKNLIAEGQTLLKSTTSLSGEALTLAREELRAKLAEAKAKADELSVTARDGGRRAFASADGYVRENPWPAIGIAVGVGFLLGALATRH